MSARRRTVTTFEELVGTPLAGGVNALCWPRALDADFAAVARALAPEDGVVDVDAAALRALASRRGALGAAGRVAIEAILEDLERLDALGLEPLLSCITSYARDERGLAIATDVLSFHADRSPVEVSTWLCTYTGKSSEGLDNDHARRLVDDPAVRAALLAQLPCEEHEDDDARLRDGAFDLHYALVDAASTSGVFSFGVGSLWRIAVEWPGAPVPPCLHRAPAMAPGDAPRLLLIA